MSTKTPAQDRVQPLPQTEQQAAPAPALDIPSSNAEAAASLPAPQADAPGLLDGTDMGEVDMSVFAEPGVEEAEVAAPVEKSPKEQAEDQLEAMKAAEAAAKEAGEEYRPDVETVAAAAAAFRAALESMSPKERQAFIAKEGGELAGRIADGLRGQEASEAYLAAVSDLAGGAETLGADGVGSVTEHLFSEDGPLMEDQTFQRALLHAVRSGGGALLAADAAVTIAEKADPHFVDDNFEGKLRDAFHDLATDYRDAREARAEDQERYAAVKAGAGAAGESDIVDQELLDERAKQFEADHQHYTDDEEAAAAAFAASLAGQALLAEESGAGLSDATVDMATHLGETDAGRLAVGEALMTSGSGSVPWLEQVQAKVGDDPEQQEAFRRTIEAAAIEAMVETQAAGDPKGAADVLRGTAKALEAQDPELAERLRAQAEVVENGGGFEAIEDQAALAGEGGQNDRFWNRLGAASELGSSVAGAVASALGEAGENGYTGHRGWGAFGSAIAAAGGLAAILSTDELDAATLITGGLAMAGGVGGLLDAMGVGGGAIGSVVNGAGALFSAVSMVDHLASGDTAGAVGDAIALIGSLVAMGMAEGAASGGVALAFTAAGMAWNIACELYQEAQVSGAMTSVVEDPVVAGVLDKGITDDPAVAEEMGRLMGEGDGRNLERLKRLSEALGVPEEELIGQIVSPEGGPYAAGLRAILRDVDLDGDPETAMEDAKLAWEGWSRRVAELKAANKGWSPPAVLEAWEDLQEEMEAARKARAIDAQRSDSAG
ncbi:MAG: hypothetical protein KC621_10350 [Myxococcales bacterium]|nr:hypothetical protein [Myxococcales bacterium]